MTDIATQRQADALAAIKQAIGTEAAEDGVDLFASHHREELPASYWRQYLGQTEPDTASIIGLLQFASAWGEDKMEYIDFTLPGDVTQYVLSVHFDDAGVIDGISMES
ncbi:DUF2004 domain-containing protein [Stenotrophomonas sp. NPDC077421]|uniref:DUF2004 domain-containing protein n=1 Tax=unclassified Stenotrophomonas TaxID=196198 RepID=UPI0028A9BBC5|nr:DUF2004 domain-containing protein [Stenotrophomonas sp.]